MKQRICPLWKTFLLFLMFLPFQLFGQVNTITGTVTDEASGNPLPGVTIIVKGTTIGTISDINGSYSINASSDQTLVFSFIGFAKVEMPVGVNLEINAQLSEESTELDELVVIGYGTVKKSDATGSISSVSSKDFNKGAITSAQDLLVGKSAGVVITTSGGAPGSGATIRIRGGSSLNASNDPLMIIDGVPIDNNNVGGSANILSFINPNDIETMTVLKDASATAIYGSRASNGVIIITTKKGKVGSGMKISYDVNTSIGKAIKFVDVYTGEELRQMASDTSNAITYKLFKPGKAKLGNMGIASLDSAANTNWQDEIFRTSVSVDHNLSISGAAKNLPYRVSLGYTNSNGIMKNTDMKRTTAAISLEPTFLKNDLKVSINAKGMNTDNNFGDAGALGSAIAMDPTKPIYDTTAAGGYFQWGNYGANLGTNNPVEQLLRADNISNVKRGIGNIQFDYKLRFLPELHANLNLAADYTQGVGHNNRSLTSPTNLSSSKGRLSDYSGTNTNKLLDFYLNYAKDLSSINSRIDATAGYSYQHFNREGFSNTGKQESDSAYIKTDSSDFITENLLISFFGRLNYTLADKYLLTMTLRDDGSSRFAEGNRWGLFPSAAFAWKINREAFLKDVEVLTDLKLRLGWGVTGQQDIGSDYPAQALYVLSSPGFYYPIDGVLLPTLRPNPYDPHIKWEQTTTQNIGLDFGFAKDRITGTLDIYKRVTKDLLNNVTVPSGSNFSNRLFTNVGSLQNKGVELSLNLIPVSQKDLFVNLGFNVTYNQNEITKLLISDDPNYIGILYGDAFTGLKQVSRVGSPALSYFLNKQVYDTNGNPIEGLYVDLSGMGGAVNGDNADKYVYKNPAPDLLLGLSGRLNYKNFDMSFSTRANIGNYVFNQIAAGASYDQMYQIGYWHNEPTYLDQSKFVKRQFTSDYFINNASFFKVDNISAGYMFENIVNKLSARVSLTVQNLLTISKYEGIDPEVNGGIDNNFYPRPRTYMLGINLTF